MSCVSIFFGCKVCVYYVFVICMFFLYVVICQKCDIILKNNWKV